MQRRAILIAAIALAAVSLIIFVFKLTGAGKKAAKIQHPEGAYIYVPVEKVPAVALVLDDFGYTKKNLKEVNSLGIPITLAVLPNTPYSKAVCSFADKSGMEVILHMPMEPEREDVALEKDTLLVEMDPKSVSDVINRAFESVPSAKGMNNHMGSKATGDNEFMTAVLKDLKKRDMFFLDSRTSKDTVCKQAALKAGIAYLGRDVFIDNELDPESIKRQMHKVEKMVLEGSDVIAIGHDRAMTVKVLKEVVPEMKEKGIKFVTLSEMAGKDVGSRD
jgi:polysaccharide deacetylase 2 family uncharacterized protein YibQ